jgi:hypothetical protein
MIAMRCVKRMYSRRTLSVLPNMLPDFCPRIRAYVSNGVVFSSAYE